MIFKDYKGKQISVLGMGNMRLPTDGEGREAPVNLEKAFEIIDYVYAQGVNYFDTAYMYHNGQSEIVIGKALARYPRDSFYLADKYPGFNLQPDTDVSVIFEDQLRKCQVDYFDFYMLHNVNDQTINNYMGCPAAIDYFMEQKKAGRIRNFGFSCHCSVENLRKMLDWKDCWDFVQIQCNYLDWTLQDAKGKYELLTERSIPVMVMEPCRGGKLASLGEAADAMLKAARPDDTVASWAFRFIKSLPNVQVCLSGMTAMDQAIDNVKTFSTEETMSDADRELLQGALDEMMKHYTAPCTACRYCCDGCPVNLDIPALMSIYNEYVFDAEPALADRMAELEVQPSECVGCGQCAHACPQSIDIPGIMTKLAEFAEQMAARRR